MENVTLGHNFKDSARTLVIELLPYAEVIMIRESKNVERATKAHANSILQSQSWRILKTKVLFSIDIVIAHIYRKHCDVSIHGCKARHGGTCLHLGS